MGGLALLAREQGWRVSGCDRDAWPPLSTLLSEQGIAVTEGYDPSQLDTAPGLVAFGNALSRGNPLVEAVLERGLEYTSGAQWLGEQVLRGRRVIAVAGTHGKTTTTAMLAWILEAAGCEPGFLIAGMPGNFPVSARLGRGDWFVIEADEYDTAFFDKRSKFVHYRPRVAALLNLEYDHADIFDSVADIERQFHYLVRTVPASGTIIVNDASIPLARVLAAGCWSQSRRFRLADAADATRSDADWVAAPEAADGSVFTLGAAGGARHRVQWDLCGSHNVENALAALAAAAAAGVEPAVAAAALCTFKAPRRRLEYLGQHAGVHIYDDLAHHPTAIRRTLDGLRARRASGGGDGASGGGGDDEGKDEGRLVAVLEKRSNSMRMGVHDHALPQALAAAERVFVLCPEEHAATGAIFERPVTIETKADALLAKIVPELGAGDYVVFLSNGGFGNIQHKLIKALQRRSAK